MEKTEVGTDFCFLLSIMHLFSRRGGNLEFRLARFSLLCPCDNPEAMSVPEAGQGRDDGVRMADVGEDGLRLPRQQECRPQCMSLFVSP